MENLEKIVELGFLVVGTTALYPLAMSCWGYLGRTKDEQEKIVEEKKERVEKEETKWDMYDKDGNYRTYDGKKKEWADGKDDYGN